MLKPWCFKSLFLILVLAVPSLVFSAPITTAQLIVKKSTIQQLEQKVLTTGKPVSVIVRFDDKGVFIPGKMPDVTKLKTAQDAFLTKLNGKITNIQRFGAFPFLAYTVKSSGLALMRADADVVSVQENRFLKVGLDESVPLIGAHKAWNGGYTGIDQIIAIMDTGVDRNHPFLAGKVVLEACFSEDDFNADKETVCPNNETYQFGPGAARPCMSLDETCQHGTHVAGIAAGNNGSTFGVAPEASIFAIQVFTKSTDPFVCEQDEDFCMITSQSSQLAALDLVYKRKLFNKDPIAAINMSFGGLGEFDYLCDDIFPFMTNAVSWLKDLGVATIVASMNSGYTNATAYPACLSDVISVGSICDGSTGSDGGADCPQGADTIAEHSNIASFISLVAPGSWINSSVPGGGYANWNGTSMAAPHVAGAWALMKQYNPMATVDDVLKDLRDNALTINDTRVGAVVTKLKALDLSFLENPDSLLDASIIVRLEEPSNGEMRSGVGNLRGWATGPDGIAEVHLYKDGEFIVSIPYGGARGDVGDLHPGYPNSSLSGFGMTWNFSGETPGATTFSIKAIAPNGKFNQLSATPHTVRFHKPFFLNPDAVDITGSTLSKEGKSIVIENLSVEGQLYDVRLEWRKSSQDFNIVEIK